MDSARRALGQLIESAAEAQKQGLEKKFKFAQQLAQVNCAKQQLASVTAQLAALVDAGAAHQQRASLARERFDLRRLHGWLLRAGGLHPGWPSG